MNKGERGAFRGHYPWTEVGFVRHPLDPRSRSVLHRVYHNYHGDPLSECRSYRLDMSIRIATVPRVVKVCRLCFNLPRHFWGWGIVGPGGVIVEAAEQEQLNV